MDSNVSLVWATPNGEELVAYMARVSNPENQNNPATAPKLLKYLIKNKHWSPFEMVHLCMEIRTTRDIARQILRHRSFSFQEFSQRYAAANAFSIRECRMQDERNRQNSLPSEDMLRNDWWDRAQEQTLRVATALYNDALSKGIAKEQARALLPEGLTMSTMYMAGSLRSWLHYCDIRCDAATQKEHRDIAEQCRKIVCQQFPSIGEIYNETV